MRNGKNTVIGKTAIYSEKDNRSVRPKATHFMGKAGKESSNKIESIFVNEAVKEINRI